MSEKIFSKEEWSRVLEDLTGNYKVFVPVKTGDFHTFTPLEKGIKPDFSYSNTRLSPKGIVYPQSERMFEYTTNRDDPDWNILKEVPKDFTPQVLVGIRPCDAHAFNIVKRNFDTPDYKDPWWVQRYEATTLVGLGCNTPSSTCFCTAMGGSPFKEEGLDAIMYDLGDSFLVQGITEKGEVFIEKTRGGERPGEKDLEEAKRLVETVTAGMPDPISVDSLREKPINYLFEAPFWEDIAFPCLNCGTCTYLCPTCWCFEIQDEVIKGIGDRIRNWDSCMFPIFTLHGSGHNPRDKKFKRVRQRFMHKLKYYVDKYEDGFQCSGCGRCVQFCPVNIDIRKVLQLMLGA